MGFPSHPFFSVNREVPFYHAFQLEPFLLPFPWHLQHLRASQYVHPEVVKLLLEKGADVNAKSHYEGYEITPVIHAIKSRHLSVVELLLEQEDISITDDEYNMVVDQEHLDETDPDPNKWKHSGISYAIEEQYRLYNENKGLHVGGRKSKKSKKSRKSKKSSRITK